MKSQSRECVYETASSSIHTIAISSKGLQMNRLKVHDDGYVHVDLDEYFGKDEKLYDTQKMKLKYIVAWFYVCYGDELDESYTWKEFNEKFAKYVNEHTNKSRLPIECQGVKIDKVIGDSAYDFFDHQQLSDGVYNDSGVVSLWHTEECVEFIFNGYIALKTGCD